MIWNGTEEGPTGDAMMWSFAWQNLVTRPSRTALAVLGLTIPVLAFLGLFSLSGGIRHLMGDTLAGMQNLMVLQRERAGAGAQRPAARDGRRARGRCPA